MAIYPACRIPLPTFMFKLHVLNPRTSAPFPSSGWYSSGRILGSQCALANDTPPFLPALLAIDPFVTFFGPPGHSHPEVPPEWPSLEALLQYRDTVRHQMEQLYCQYRLPSTATTTNSSSSSKESLPLMPVDIQEVLWMGFEHEAMHLETLMYMLVQYEHVLPPPPALQGWYSSTNSSCGGHMAAAAGNEGGSRVGAAAGVLGSSWDGGIAAPPKPWLVTVPGGRVTKGFNGTLSSSASSGTGVVEDGGLGFGWDNEQPEQQVEVSGFSMQYRAVTVGEYCWFLAGEILKQQQQGEQGEGQHRIAAAGGMNRKIEQLQEQQQGQQGEQGDGLHVSSSAAAGAGAGGLNTMLQQGGELCKLLPASWKVLPESSFGSTTICTPSARGSNSLGAATTAAGGDDEDDEGVVGKAAGGIAAAAGASESGAVVEQLCGMLSVRSVYGAVPLGAAWLWPVYTSGLQAEAYADAADMRLPTEGELLRAWQWEQQQQLGSSTAAASGATAACGATAGATAGVAFNTWHPVDVDMWGQGSAAKSDSSSNNSNTSNSSNSSSSSSKSCFSQLRCNGWELSSSVFDFHPGFSPDPKYPEYSQDFFDGKHHVLLGASWATLPQIAGRESFRNWYQQGYPYAFAKFRLCAKEQ